MSMMGMGTISAPFLYVPDLAPVGSKSTYFPRSVDRDAMALNFLQFMSDSALDDLTSSMGSQSADMNNEAGAWDPAFRASVTRFQVAKGLTADSWIGPQTRTALAAAVAFKNANPGTLPSPLPQVVPVIPGQVPAKPAVLPGVTPASAKTEDDTLMYLGIGAGVLALGGLAWYALK
jgi:hypothetical protein